MDRDRLITVERELALVARQIAGLPVRIAEGGGGVSGGSSDVRFRLTAARTPEEPISDSIFVELIDANDAVYGMDLVYDEDHRYFGPAGSRGIANYSSPANNYQVSSMEDSALGARALIDSQFDYATNDSAVVSQFLDQWGPPDQRRAPTATEVFDPDYFVVNAQPDDTVHVTLRTLEDGAGARGYHAAYPHFPPQLLWAWSPSGSATDGDPVNAGSNKKYEGKLIRYDGNIPSASTSFEIVDDAELCFANGETPQLKHKQRLIGFRIGTGSGAGLFAIVSGAGAGGAFTANAASAISAGSPSAPASGTATVYEVTASGTTNLGQKTVKNPFVHGVKGALALAKIDEDNYLVTGFDLLQALSLLPDFNALKYLGTPSGGGSPTGIKWLPTTVCGSTP